MSDEITLDQLEWKFEKNFNLYIFNLENFYLDFRSMKWN